MTEITLTLKEKRAIRQLKELAKTWPDTLWLFSAPGTLTVMRTDENGRQATIPLSGGMGKETGGGVDPAYIVDTIPIPSDGGDW